MMFMRRSPFGMFLMVGVGVLLGAALFGSSQAVGGVVAAPFVILGIIFKIALFFLLFGFVARMFAGSFGRGGGKGWCGPSAERWSKEARSHWQRRHDASSSEEEPSKDDRFEEWHRMAHARQEVDDHVPPVED